MAVSKASKVPPKNNTSTSGTTAIPTVSHPKSPAHQATRRASSGRFVRAKSCARKDKIIPANRQRNCKKARKARNNYRNDRKRKVAVNAVCAI